MHMQDGWIIIINITINNMLSCNNCTDKINNKFLILKIPQNGNLA